MSTELFSLSGRIAFVTGASSGIGRGLVKGLADAGARVVAVARRTDRLAGWSTRSPKRVATRSG